MFPLQLNEEELYEREKTWRKKQQVQLNFNFQPNLNSNQASEESKLCWSSFPGQEEGERQGLGLFKEMSVAWDPDSWETSSTSLLVKLSRNQTSLLFGIRIELYFLHRSAPEGMNVMNVIQWISMLQEVN